jgi:choline dehydrogenase-like flavoprotein
MEMEPDPENRVTLAADLDPYGQPVPLVRHRSSELGRRSLIALHAALGEELERCAIGRLESDLASADPWPIDQDASHHMGTTRMGTDPRSSVVDPDLRLHAVPNVFLAGASVFPTSGCANPTFTIVALSIRLARHLQGVLQLLPAAV